MNFRDFEEIDWDSDEDEDGNLAHCLRTDHLGPEPERVVNEVLSEQPVEIKYKVKTAEFAIVGPDRSRSGLWVISSFFNSAEPRIRWRARRARRTVALVPDEAARAKLETRCSGCNEN